MLIVEIPYRDPIAAFVPFAGDAVAALLHSAVPGEERSRWSYIAAAPFLVIRAEAGSTGIDGRPAPGSPFDVLARELARLGADAATEERPEHPAIPFRAGAVGYLGYELGRHLERLPAPWPSAPAVPEMVMGLYDVIAAFDHRERRAFVVSSGRPAEAGPARQARAEARAQMLLDRLATAPEVAPEPLWQPGARLAATAPRAEVEAAIARAIAYIHAGDIFQANITQEMRAPCPAGLTDLELYGRLCALSPAPFSALLRCGPDLSLLSASPERFLRLSATGEVETRPIKGTRPRGRDAAEDRALAEALLASPKDRAANLMIGERWRNDLGRVCTLGSITVPSLCALERFASVHHLVSEVRGRLRPGLGAVDLLKAAFPGGSITGAPKIRAMEIIHELERRPRGAYCGAVAWLGFDGAMDSSIIIRTITRAGGELLAQAGGGIVADSDPAAEYEESLVKLQPLMRAVAGDRP